MNLITKTIIILIILTACGRSETKTDSGQNTWNNEELIMATLFNYYSAEYIALSYQAYNIASERLQQIANKETNRSKMAVIVDIDETILDNSPFQAITIESGEPYPANWNEWCNLEAARPVPGSLEFLNYADSLGFKIFYISNRKIDPLYKATFNNLRELGFPQVNSESMMLREVQTQDNPDPSDKEQRRIRIEASGYTIALLAGDNLGDFFIDDTNRIERSQKVERLKEEFGKRYIVLPNAMYGNWPASLGIDGNEEAYRVLLNEMTKPFRETRK